eukprot:ctg_544.g311
MAAPPSCVPLGAHGGAADAHCGGSGRGTAAGAGGGGSTADQAVVWARGDRHGHSILAEQRGGGFQRGRIVGGAPGGERLGRHHRRGHHGRVAHADLGRGVRAVPRGALGGGGHRLQSHRRCGIEFHRGGGGGHAQIGPLGTGWHAASGALLQQATAARNIRALSGHCAGRTRPAMMLYNIPGRTGINMLPDTTMQLARDFPNIVAVKEATGDMDQFAKIRNGTDASSFALYSGDDGLTLPLLALGGSGAVSVASHFIGKELQAMVQAFQRGAAAEALRIHCRYMELFTALFVMANPIPAKAALRLQGWSVGVPRLPLTDITPEAEAKLRAVMTQVGLLRRE